jgi:hypothetical protein
MRRRASNSTITLVLTTSMALAACGDPRTCVDPITHEVLPRGLCEDERPQPSSSGSSFGSYRPHAWWYGGHRTVGSSGTAVIEGGSGTPPPDSHGGGGQGSSRHVGGSSGYHGSGGHGFGTFHGSFGG